MKTVDSGGVFFFQQAIEVFELSCWWHAWVLTVAESQESFNFSTWCSRFCKYIEVHTVYDACWSDNCCHVCARQMCFKIASPSNRSTQMRPKSVHLHPWWPLILQSPGILFFILKALETGLPTFLENLDMSGNSNIFVRKVVFALSGKICTCPVISYSIILPTSRRVVVSLVVRWMKFCISCRKIAWKT